MGIEPHDFQFDRRARWKSWIWFPPEQFLSLKQQRVRSNHLNVDYSRIHFLFFTSTKAEATEIQQGSSIVSRSLSLNGLPAPGREWVITAKSCQPSKVDFKFNFWRDYSACDPRPAAQQMGNCHFRVRVFYSVGRLSVCVCSFDGGFAFSAKRPLKDIGNRGQFGWIEMDGAFYDLRSVCLLQFCLILVTVAGESSRNLG